MDSLREQVRLAGQVPTEIQILGSMRKTYPKKTANSLNGQELLLAPGSVVGSPPHHNMGLRCFWSGPEWMGAAEVRLAIVRLPHFSAATAGLAWTGLREHADQSVSGSLGHP